MLDYETYGEACDWVLSRDEHDANGELVWRRVLRRFVRQSLVLNLHVRGQLIGTTAEHPFFVSGTGWTPAHSLRIGDVLLSHDGQHIAVDGVADSGRIETVYNVEVEHDHTYFVGCDQTWGWSVWSHNSYFEFEQIVTNPALKKSLDTAVSRLMYNHVAKGGEAGLRQALKDAGLHHSTIEKAIAVARADGVIGNLNWMGQPVIMPKGHILSPHDPPMSAKPVVDPGPFTTAQRARFLAGETAANLAPHHRHQVPVFKGGVIDDLPGSGHPLGNMHTGVTPNRHPNPSEFATMPNGDSIRRAETRRHWRDKGNRLVETSPGSGVWLDPGH